MKLTLDAYRGTLVLLRPDGESTKTAPVDKIMMEDSWLLTSSDLEEAWFEGWYEKEGIPSIWDMPYSLVPPSIITTSEPTSSATEAATSGP